MPDDITPKGDTVFAPDIRLPLDTVRRVVQMAEGRTTAPLPPGGLLNTIAVAQRILEHCARARRDLLSWDNATPERLAWIYAAEDAARAVIEQADRPPRTVCR